MLIAMTFNGYIIIAIVLGAIFGHFFSTWDTIGSSQIVDFDDIGHGYTSDFPADKLPAANIAEPCCRPLDRAGASSNSSSSDDIVTAKQQVISLPSHGYGTGACCV
jgi:copper transporter 1